MSVLHISLSLSNEKVFHISLLQSNLVSLLRKLCARMKVADEFLYLVFLSQAKRSVCSTKNRASAVFNVLLNRPHYVLTVYSLRDRSVFQYIL